MCVYHALEIFQILVHIVIYPEVYYMLFYVRGRG